ncbi:tryptophan synthase subunit alpha [Candidatus Bathyarchaeota archaeon]|nr:MAG: tryptophan synthase subunit alpha [Candidatus Bathyarchaeota archaeon]
MDLGKKFHELKEKNEGVHMAHVYYGDPNEEFSIKLIKTLAENGADIIEFGIPFSDPIADGPTFQAACERALKNGVTPTKCIQGIRKLRNDGLNKPIVVTTYYNIPYIMGVEHFLNKIKMAGVQALIVPDLPVEEANSLIEQAKKFGIHVILQVTPTTSENRLKRIIENASGFIYIIGVEGVTGAREKLGESTIKLVRKVKNCADIPVIVGFGISKEEHAKRIISAGADGVVVGSAYTEIYSKNLNNPEKTLPKIAHLVKQIKKGCLKN